ncbi:MAG: hypothetical protein ACYSWR_06665 [Planctomycetota bacterium]|jgi:hypothetical protein
MSGMDNAIAISASIIKSKLEGKTDLEDILNSAMDAALTESCTWLIGDEDLKFNAAIAAIYLVVDEDTQERVKKEITFLRSLNAASSGVPVNFGALLEDDEIKVIGLQKYWKAALERKAKG